jgi:threonine/homoserine/homoserine lactone efflux protein
MTLASAMALAVAVLVLAATPGPAVVTIVARALAGNIRAAIGFSLGCTAGDITFMLAAVFGLAAVAQAMGDLFILVRIAGGAYLVWLGWKLWTAPPVEPAAGSPPPREASLGRAAVSGYLLTMGNPKAIVFYAAFLPTFMDLTRLDAMDVLVMAAVIAAVLLVVLMSYIALAWRARRLFRSRRSMRVLNCTAGTLIAGAGIAVATR